MLIASYSESYKTTSIPLDASDTEIAQAFISTRDTYIGRVKLDLSITGSLSAGYLYVEIQSDASGPSNSKVDKYSYSNAIPASSIVSGLNEFIFNIDTRCHISNDTTYYIVLKTSGYTPDVDNYIGWNADSESHYFDGSAYIKDSTWSEQAGTCAAFYIYSGHRDTVYSRISDVEALQRSITINGKFNKDSIPTAADVMDAEEYTSDMIDGWLSGAGLPSPLTSEQSIRLIRYYANACVAHQIELTQVAGGYTSDESGTRGSTLKRVCDTLMKDLAKGDIIAVGIGKEEGVGGNISGGEGLTAGYIESDELADATGDTALIQPKYRVGMFDNS